MARAQGIMEKHMNDRNETFPETNRASVEKGMAYFMHAGPIYVLGTALSMFQISFRTCNLPPCCPPRPMPGTRAQRLAWTLYWPQFITPLLFKSI